MHCAGKKKAQQVGQWALESRRKKTSGGWKRKFSRRPAEYLGNHGFSRAVQWTCRKSLRVALFVILRFFQYYLDMSSFYPVDNLKISILGGGSCLKIVVAIMMLT